MKIDNYLLFDGAMGTYYAGKNRPYSLSQANLLDYNTIVSIHKEYIASGAMAITANTFGIENTDSIRAAISAAFDAAKDRDTLVFASIGPINSYEKADYMPIIDIMAKSGVTNFIFETFPSEELVIELSKYIKKKTEGSYIIASFASDQNGYTAQGKYIYNILSKIKVIRTIDAFGMNCVIGPLHMKELAAKIDKTGALSVMPNAGYPSFSDNRPSYINNPEYFAEQLFEIYKLGAKILGGCCGTTPKHIAAVKELLENEDSDFVPQIRDAVKPVHKLRNVFEQKLKYKKVIVVEYDPPLSATAEEITASSRLFKEAGADAISVADNPLGKARADCLLIASRIKRDTKDISVIPHITCRDRNSISIRSALMGLSIEGINDVLCITGDPVPACSIRQAKGVYSFNSVTLIDYMESISHELYSGSFFLGAALNINANHFQIELDRAHKKCVTGAKYLITQPCFSDRAYNNALLAKEVLKVPIIAGIMPIKSYRNAVFIKSEISGIDIPDEIALKYKDKTTEECEELSFEISLEIIRKLYDFVDGFHLITPPKGEKLIARLIREIKKI